MPSIRINIPSHTINLNTYDIVNYNFCKIYIELHNYINNNQTVCEEIVLSQYENRIVEIDVNTFDCIHISVAKAYLEKYKSEGGAREINLSRYDFDDYKYCKLYRKRHHSIHHRLHYWEDEYNVFYSNLRNDLYIHTDFYIRLNDFTWPDFLIAGKYLKKYERKYKRDKERIRDNTNRGQIFSELGSSRGSSMFRVEDRSSRSRRSRSRSRSGSLGGRTRRRTCRRRS